MEPRIQYAKTKDGVSIAYSVVGDGRPFVYMPDPPWFHLQLLWQIPEQRQLWEMLTETRKLIRYDSRGHGLSQRDIPEYSLEGYLLDLEAVVDQLALEKFTLFGLGASAPVAITYAAEHPERLSHLILWGWARAADFAQSPQTRSLASLLGGDWELFTEAAAHAALGWEEGEPARRFAACMRECVSQEGARRALVASLAFDVTERLPEVKTPTLIFHPRRSRLYPVEAALAFASQVPNAKLVLLEGESNAVFLGEGRVQAVVAAIAEFLGEERPAVITDVTAAFRTVLFTDIVGHTEMMARLGDEQGREVLREHERITREVLKEHGGTEIKTMGDGFMASFSSVTRAVECAVALQRAFAERNAGAAELFHVRVGLNAGEPIAEKGDLFGASVIAAARIARQAQGGEILVSDVVRQLVAGKGFLFSERGEVALRGFEDPVRLYEVRWRE